MLSFRRLVPCFAVIFLLLFFALRLPALASGGQAAAAAPLTNDDVIKMVQAKLPDGVIVAKIKGSPTKFDTSLDTLIKSKQAGISDAVMQAMTEAVPAAPAVKEAPPDPNDPLAAHDPGIYYVRQTPTGRQMTMLDPTAYSGSHTGGMFATAMTYGIAKSKTKAVVRGARANVRFTEKSPVFYFYFEKTKGTLSFAGLGSFAGLTSPSQFSLVHLEPKKDRRELVVGEFSTYTNSTGTRSQDVADFNFEKIGPGVYKVVPKADLQPGEYCFFFTGENRAGAGSGNLFDFGIDSGK
jgi:hypothetical protein